MVIYLDSVAQLCCREGGTLQTNITDVCGEYSQCLGHTGFAPATRCVCFPNLVFSGSRLFCRRTVRWALGCMHFPGLSCSGSGSWVLHKGLNFVPFPGPSSSGHQILGGHTLPRLGRESYHLPSPSRWVSWGRSGRAVSDVPCFSSGELISGCDPSGGCQPSRIPGRLG